MSLQTVPANGFSFFSKKPVGVETTELRLTSDAGLLPFRELDQQLGFTAELAGLWGFSLVGSLRIPRSERGDLTASA